MIAEPGANNDLKAEAGLLQGRKAMEANSLDDAYVKFKAVVTASTSEAGAEAKYHMAYVRYMQGKYTDTEKEVFDLVKKYPSYEDWKARGFILLADAYVQLNDRFQAKATLQSVIDHVSDPELVAQARTRLDTILASEVQQTTPAPQEEIEAPIDESNPRENDE
ncbi:MAG: hypothetical protein IPI07_03610 [Flavobacteriales bacterium]|nr:hypothetical protein [Flavobacteriales bacterium]